LSNINYKDNEMKKVMQIKYRNHPSLPRKGCLVAALSPWGSFRKGEQK